MFWRFGGYANISSLDSILDKPDVSVEDLLEESDLIQELKQQNSKLIEFLRDEAVLEKLLKYVTAPKIPGPPEDSSQEKDEKAGGIALDSFFGKRSRSKSVHKNDTPEGEESTQEKQRLKYSYVACEILSSEVWSISEALLENHTALRNFWQYIKRPAPLDPLQAGYFTKVNEALLDRKTEEMLDFFKTLDGVVADMLRHCDCPMIMDLLLKIVSLERNEGGQGIVDWLQMQGLIPQLLAYLSPEHSSATQTSAGDFLKAIITISANATTQDQNVIGPNELTRQLVSEPCIQVLIKGMLRGGNPLTVGVGIVIEVIRKNNSDYDLDNQIGPVPKSSDPIYLGTLLRQFAVHVPDFMELILNNNHATTNSDGTTTIRRKEIKSAFGKKIEPLGFDRFKTCELMAELLHCSNMALLNERGSETEIKGRDVERERLKAEGKLQPANEDPLIADFGTSVDSSGFHHARAPSVSDDSPEVIKRSDVANAPEEEEFEKVTTSEALAEEIQGEIDEKLELMGEPLERSPKTQPQYLSETSEHREFAEKSEQLDSMDGADKPPPLKPTPKEEHADSPTSAGLTDKVGGLDLDNDTEMTSDESEKPKEDEKSVPPTTNDDVLPSPTSPSNGHPEDKPPPLFFGKSQTADQDAANSSKQPSTAPLTATPSEGQAQADDAGSTHSIVHPAQDDQYGAHYEVDLDGSPVVGDRLKMQFVAHRVVPTILDFFFRFPWNNFLHNVVYDVVQQVFNGQMDRGFNRGLAIDLFDNARITDRIIEGQQINDKTQQESNMRLGYMGHLTLIAEEVVKFTERHPPEFLSQSVLDKVMSQPWIDYVEQTLAETRERDNAILGGVRPDMSVGPRQAVLNAVNAAQGFGGSSNSLANAGLGGNGTIGLDSMDLTNQGSASGGYSFSGNLSGFTHSSDEEDEEMEEGEEKPQNPAIDADEQVGELSFDDIDMDYR
ncbi:extragenic suppressor of kinetochore protein 1 [Aulographum hederae CBS 113979]|uniref:Extragenic suppressor of kinetochore protein 1 n=1 Tax=Aulographum hederae CBS 113979 TaxID=1176131 RepID=A0A6G1HFI9_9PEZI|nr:extragenic suppressor of kinetochore protein 1 [Aulographum hederae CBS 113979]